MGKASDSNSVPAAGDAAVDAVSNGDAPVLKVKKKKKDDGTKKKKKSKKVKGEDDEDSVDKEVSARRRRIGRGDRRNFECYPSITITTTTRPRS